MGKIDIKKTELVWPGKYDENGQLVQPERANLPFQVIERIAKGRARLAGKGRQTTLFETWQAKEGDTFEAGWTNKLIWGDNQLVMSSLLDKFAGKIDLIYIDPPFATGADFSFTTPVGEESSSLHKDASLLEEKAYRDTWGQGLDSYLAMIWSRLLLMRDLLSASGTIYVHIGPYVGPYVKTLLDRVFAYDNAIAEIVWKRQVAHSDSKSYARLHDYIYCYSKGSSYTFTTQYAPYSEKHIRENYRYKDDKGVFALGQLKAPGNRGPKYEWNGITRHWRLTLENMKKMDGDGGIYYSDKGIPWKKLYLHEMPGVAVGSVWTDINPIHAMDKKERLDYDTQKPESLLERVIKTSSKEGDLVADFFCGSGTTLAVAERLGRRWIGSDLGRYGIHVTRKRLLGIENIKPFEVLNLGKYERQYWQGVTFGDKDRDVTQQALFEYLAFILKLYGAQPLTGMEHVHGRRGSALVHIGPVDAPVTIDEINAAVDECLAVKQTELHVLGWEWEMGITGGNPTKTKEIGPIQQEAKRKGIKLILLNIPREVMDQQAIERNDVKFFELAYLEAEPEINKREVLINLKDFVLPNTELVPEEVRKKIKKWSDYVDYWAVDWDYQEDTFHVGWVSYRTRKDRTLILATKPHAYEKAGTYQVMVKVVDIFGNDSSHVLEVKVK